MFTHGTDTSSVASLLSRKQSSRCKMHRTKQSSQRLFGNESFPPNHEIRFPVTTVIEADISEYTLKNILFHAVRVRILSLVLLPSRRLSLESGESIFRVKCVRKCELRALT
jgi:hypothetical protein